MERMELVKHTLILELRIICARVVRICDYLKITDVVLFVESKDKVVIFSGKEKERSKA